MDAGGAGSSAAKMRDRWQAFAQADAMYYVATTREAWSKDDFYATGRGMVREVLDWAGPFVARDRMLEIGCGAGRMLAHFVHEFDRVDGTDISPTMIDIARENIADPSVHFHAISGAELDGLPSRAFDFVFSFQVLQHIPDMRVVTSYLHETNRVLRPDGKAVLQFDTRPNPWFRQLALALPDFALPRPHRRCIRRYPLPESWPRVQAEAAGLTVVDERLRGSDAHMLLLEPDARVRLSATG